MGIKSSPPNIPLITANMNSSYLSTPYIVAVIPDFLEKRIECILFSRMYSKKGSKHFAVVPI